MLPVLSGILPDNPATTAKDSARESTSPVMRAFAGNMPGDYGQNARGPRN